MSVIRHQAILHPGAPLLRHDQPLEHLQCEQVIRAHLIEHRFEPGDSLIRRVLEDIVRIGHRCEQIAGVQGEISLPIAARPVGRLVAGIELCQALERGSIGRCTAQHVQKAFLCLREMPGGFEDLAQQEITFRAIVLLQVADEQFMRIG